MSTYTNYAVQVPFLCYDWGYILYIALKHLMYVTFKLPGRSTTYPVSLIISFDGTLNDELI